MKEAIKLFDDLPWIVKIILCIPVLDVVWNVYRLLRSIEAKNIVGIILSVLLLTAGIAFVWIIDIICVILNKQVWWFC
ncbi:MAG: hypothetical protein IKT54_05070 [Clostridia bacterium]|nr:hypothetical protein [Clostridia bacterium]